MKPIRITTVHQSITFSRRMLMLGGAEAAVVDYWSGGWAGSQSPRTRISAPERE